MTMINLFGDEYADAPKYRKPPDKRKRAWEDAFQKWSNENSQNGLDPLGCCGFGAICDYCEDPAYGRPCVRALNAMVKDKRLTVDYGVRNFADWFMGDA